MSTTNTGDGTSTETSAPETFEMRLEVVAVPVSDVDRAMHFYVTTLGWRLDADFSGPGGFRGVQVTPPGSSCSVHFGHGVTAAPPGSADHLFLVVSDIEAGRAALVKRGVEVSEIFHLAPGEEPAPGPDPERATYQSYAAFSDPDGNRWSLQEVTTRLPGR